MSTSPRPSGDPRIQARPTTRPLLEPDEDAPAFPAERMPLDLTGNYRTEIVIWMEQAQTNYNWFCLVPMLMVPCFVPAIALLSVPLALLAGVWCWVPLVLLVRPIWFGGLFLVAVRGMRQGASEWNEFWEVLLAPRLLLANLLSSLLWLLPLVVVALFEESLLVLDPSKTYTLAAWACAWLVAFYFHVRWWFAHMLILDLQMSIYEAFATSWTLTRSHVLGLSCFLLLLAVILVVGASFFGFGILAAMAFVTLAEASAYLHATGQMPRAKMTP